MINDQFFNLEAQRKEMSLQTEHQVQKPVFPANICIDWSSDLSNSHQKT